MWAKGLLCAKDCPRHIGEGSHAQPWPHGAGSPAEETDGGTYSFTCRSVVGRAAKVEGPWAEPLSAGG